VGRERFTRPGLAHAYPEGFIEGDELLGAALSLSLIRSGRNGGVGRRGPAVEECCRQSGWLEVGAHPWPATGVFGAVVVLLGTSAAHDVDVAPRRRSHDRSTRVSSSRSIVRHSRSAMAIAALSVCREWPSLGCGA